MNEIDVQQLRELAPAPAPMDQERLTSVESFLLVGRQGPAEEGTVCLTVNGHLTLVVLECDVLSARRRGREIVLEVRHDADLLVRYEAVVHLDRESPLSPDAVRFGLPDLGELEGETSPGERSIVSTRQAVQPVLRCEPAGAVGDRVARRCSLVFDCRAEDGDAST